MMGAVLRAERERRGLTVKDIERETSIRSAYIEALESGRYEALPSEVYVKGFIRNYAGFLRLDAGALVRQYREETRGAEEEPAAAQPPRNAERGDHAPFASGSDFHERVEKSHRAQIFLTIAAVIAVVFVGGIYYFFGEDPAVKPPARIARQETPSSAPLSSAETRQDAAQGRKNGAPEAAAGQEDVRVRLTGRCWLYAVADGKDVYEGTAEANQTFHWTGKESVVITAGNAGAVEITYNGKPTGALGKAGEVVEKRFGRSGDSARKVEGGK